MKKIRAAILLVVCLWGFSGCSFSDLNQALAGGSPTEQVPGSVETVSVPTQGAAQSTIVQLGEPLEMGRATETGGGRPPAQGVLRFTLQSAEVFDSPLAAGLTTAQLGEMCGEAQKPTEDSCFILLECTLENVSAVFQNTPGVDEEDQDFYANSYSIKKLGEDGNFVSTVGDNTLGIQSFEMYFSESNGQKKDGSDYYHITLPQGETLTYTLGFYARRSAVEQEALYYHYLGGESDSPYYVQLQFEAGVAKK